MSKWVEECFDSARLKVWITCQTLALIIFQKVMNNERNVEIWTVFDFQNDPGNFKGSLEST
jgi:hypothetical protein